MKDRLQPRLPRDTVPPHRPLGPLLHGLAFLLLALAGARAQTPPVVRSLDFNGTYSNVVHFPVGPWMDTNLIHLTVELWVYPRSLTSTQALVARALSTNLWFGLSSNRLRFARSGGAWVESAQTVPLRRWSHVAATYDGLTARFYLNGEPAGQAPLSHAGNGCTNVLSLGGQRDFTTFGDLFAAGYPFDGMLDEVRLWAAARTQAQIAAGMHSELRFEPWLLAAFGDGGSEENVSGDLGLCSGVSPANRLSGFGILPAQLCVPWTANALTVDGVIDPLGEYQGAETLVLRTGTGGTVYDQPAYLVRSINATNNHLFIGIPGLPQGQGGSNPVVQVRAALAPGGGTFELGDWEFRYRENTLQGGTRLVPPQPPLYPDPRWQPWPQGPASWNGATAGVVGEEFLQNYEFRIHAGHLNDFAKYARLLVRYGELGPGEPELTAPTTGLADQPATYAVAQWCGEAIRGSRPRSVSGFVERWGPPGPSNVGLVVSLYSGHSETTGILLGRTTTGPLGSFTIHHPAVPTNRPVTITYDPPAGPLVFRSPSIESNNLVHGIAINSPFSVTYPPTALPDTEAYSDVRFIFGVGGPIGVTGVSPTSIETRVLVRADPPKFQPANEAARITVTGVEFRDGLRVFLQGPGCTVWPPTLCAGDFLACNVVEVAADGTSLTAEVPVGLDGGWRVVVEDPSWLAVGGERWNVGPTLHFTLPTWPQLHGFAFFNADDHPSLEEFEACYGDSIFVYTPVPVRNPHYALWSVVYGIWMEETRGSCVGMASTARLLANGNIPLSTYDSPEAGGFHGVLFGNGFLGHPDDPEDAPKPARWTGFDLFQPTRPVNLWSRITSLAAAQTSAQAIAANLGQHTLIRVFGPGRGRAAGNPNAVLDRVRARPDQHVMCIYQRNWGRGHCVTPYAVLDGAGLDAAGLRIIPLEDRSIIKVYDNNRPNQECFIEVDRGFNSFRYNPKGFPVEDPERDEYRGPGLFSMPLSIFTDPRHAPGPEFLGEYGLSALRMLMVGAASATLTNVAGATAGWTTNGLTLDYPGALPYLPVGYLPGEPDRFDTTMLFLPSTNSPAGGRFTSAGSNVMIHAASGWNEVAFGFRAPHTGPGNDLYGLRIGPNQALEGLGVRISEPVAGFSAMTSVRKESGACRIWVLDAGPDLAKPDLHLELEGFDGLKLRNQSSETLNLRFGLSGSDQTPAQVFSTFEISSDEASLPAKATLRLRPLPGNTGFRRELDANNDNIPETADILPARGSLRPSREGGWLALRWRQAASQETLEVANTLESPVWTPADAALTTEGADRVARVSMNAPTGFFRVRAGVTNCLSLVGLGLGPKPNPWETTGFKFEALNAAGAMQPQNTLVTRDAHAGLDVAHTVRIHPEYECQVLHLDVFQTSGLVLFEAVGALGAIISRAELIGPGSDSQRVTLRSFRDRIHYVRVSSPNALCLIENLCGERMRAP